MKPQPGRLKVRANASYRKAKKLLEGAAHCSWKGTGFRSASLGYANPETILNGQGARIYGSRWTAPGLCRAVYLCLDPETSVLETLGKAVKAGIPAEMIKPRLIVAASIRLERLLDLSSVEGIALPKLLSESWESANDKKREAHCQAVGRAAFALGFDGILCPSALNEKALNVLVFPDLLTNESKQLKLSGTEELKHFLK